jgi:hypothetical protein
MAIPQQLIVPVGKPVLTVDQLSPLSVDRYTPYDVARAIADGVELIA